MANLEKPIKVRQNKEKIGKGLLSEIDKKILSFVLNPNGKITTYSLAKKIAAPATTVQRRRAYLEKRFLDLNYTLKLEELGFRRIDLLIGTQRGQTNKVSEELLKLEPVVYVGAKCRPAIN